MQRRIQSGALAGKIDFLFAEEGPRGGLLVSLAKLFADLLRRREFTDTYPLFETLFPPFTRSLEQGDREGAEDGLTRLYSYLHSADNSYSPPERAELDAGGGYWCHAGGLSPLWRAAPYIGPETRLADYGAGNGLQGLLLQYLYPHCRTTLIELSGPMVEKGKKLQKMMGLPDERVKWIHGNVIDIPPDRYDFIYMYRPLRPERVEGKMFYSRFARSLGTVSHRVTIFSVADCLADFLDESFKVYYSDGHLTCFAKYEPADRSGQSGER